jgi:cobalt-zinc-cadmium efflux system membrane fusion protein
MSIARVHWIGLSIALALAACKRDDAEVRASSPSVADAGANEHRVELTEAAMAAARIESEPARRSSRGPRLALPAVIEAEPSQVARVGARVSGRIAALRARVGEVVAQGAPLVEIDTVELHQVSSEFMIARARMRQARDALARAQALVADGVGATAELRRAEADERVAAATLHEAEEHLHFLGLRDRDIQRLRARSSHGGVRAIVRAPIAGRLSAVPVSVGQVVQGTETVAVLGDPSRVWVVARVFQSDLGRVRVGAAVTVAIEGAPEGERRTATIDSISDVLDPETRTASARALLSNDTRALRDGTSATVWVESESELALWIPDAALSEHDGERGVFVKTGPRSFEFRPVQLEGPIRDRVAVREGLREGEEVVVRGAFLLAGELDRAARAEAE